MLLRLAICATLLSAGCALSNAVVPDDSPLDEATVIAEIHASDQARREAAVAGDYDIAMQYIAPEFLFVHSTGQVDDLEQFRAFAERVSSTDRAAPRVVEEPKFIVHKNLAVRTRITSSSPRPNLPEARFRSMDVFVRRSGKWLWLAHQSTMVRPPWLTVSVPAALLEEYAGTYGAASGPTRVYTTRGDTLFQSALRGDASDVAMTPLSESTFAVSQGTVTVTFLRDRAGKVTRAQIAGPLGLSVLDRK